MKLRGFLMLVLGISMVNGSYENDKDLKIALLERQVNDLKGMIDVDPELSAMDEMERSLQEEDYDTGNAIAELEERGIKGILTSIGNSGEKFVLKYTTKDKKKEKDLVIVDDRRLLTTEIQKSGNDTEVLHFDHRRGVMVCRFNRLRLCNIHKMPNWMTRQNLSKEKDRLRTISANGKRRALRVLEKVRTRFVKTNRKVDFSKLGPIIPKLCKNMKSQWMKPSQEKAVTQSRKMRSLEDYADDYKPTYDLDERDFEEIDDDTHFTEGYLDDENAGLNEYEREFEEPLDDDYNPSDNYDEPQLNQFERDFNDELLDEERSLIEDPQTADEQQGEEAEDTEAADDGDDRDEVEKRSSTTAAMYAKGCRRNYECALREVCCVNTHKYCCSMGWTCTCVKYCNKSLRTCTQKQGCHYRWNCPTTGR